MGVPRSKSEGHQRESDRRMKKIYVGNLPFTTTEEEIKSLFAEHGEVGSISLVTDRETGRPRGFAFVEMAPDAADEAIKALDGKDLSGRSLRVNVARPRRDDGGFQSRRSW
jgi:RNA recognition motif-containing protein